MPALTVTLSRSTGFPRPLILQHETDEDATLYALKTMSRMDGKLPVAILRIDGEWAWAYTPLPRILTGRQQLAALFQTSPRVGVPAVRHQKDSDCTVDPRTNCCTQCGVEHGSACIRCYGRAFHYPGCPEIG